MSKLSETKRLNKLNDESRNIAKRYKLHEEAADIIEKYGTVHDQQSRAIQVAIELMWHATGQIVSIPQEIKETPLIGKNYKLTPRTVELIDKLSGEYETQGNVLAACAVVLARPDPRGKKR